MPGVMGMKKAVRWWNDGKPNQETLRAILGAREALVAEGIAVPTKRETLYKLLKAPGWSKKHYDTLCVFTEELQVRGLVPWGLWSPDGGGRDFTPKTPRSIAEQQRIWGQMVPAELGTDGFLHGVLVEHAGMTDQIADFLDFRAGVVSSQGQLRGEHLHKTIEAWVKAASELGAKGIKVIALADFDSWGKVIYDAHEAWFRRVEFSLPIKVSFWGPTPVHIRSAGLPVNEDHQLDGFVAAYGVQRFKAELRRQVGL